MEVVVEDSRDMLLVEEDMLTVDKGVSSHIDIEDIHKVLVVWGFLKIVILFLVVELHLLGLVLEYLHQLQIFFDQQLNHLLLEVLYL